MCLDLGSVRLFPRRQLESAAQLCHRLVDPRAYAATARAFGHYDWTAELGRVCVPALILQGLDDALTRPGGSVILSRGIPRSRLVMVPGAGHNLPIEMPTLFIAAVLAFLAGVDL